jgi:5-methylcytosine-specific restriction endonuclease McrA
MKKTPLARKTPLRAKTGFKRTKSPLRAKTSVPGKKTANKRKSKTELQKLKDALWAECKRITRMRYEKFTGGWDCFSCGKHITEAKNAQTGHFIASSVCSTELRYDLDNLRVQCYNCNINKSGNWIDYEKQLRIEKGFDFPERLKERNETTKGQSYREDWYKMYIANYKNIQS